jgi:hypothetical protein
MCVILRVRNSVGNSVGNSMCANLPPRILSRDRMYVCMYMMYVCMYIHTYVYFITSTYLVSASNKTYVF